MKPKLIKNMEEIEGLPKIIAVNLARWDGRCLRKYRVFNHLPTEGMRELVAEKVFERIPA